MIRGTLFVAGMALPVLMLCAAPTDGQAQESDIQQKLSNPIASLTLVPIQVNYDEKIGLVEDGYRVTTNIQPVVPIKLNDDLTLVVRTILPIVGQERIFPGSGSQFGLGDTVQSFFFVPQTVNGFTWGAGPVFLWRTGTDELLSSEKWGAGPTAVVLQQSGPWTVGTLTNHIWSYAGADDRADVNTTFVQPFVSYAMSGGITYSLNTESSYNWTAEEWSVPVNFVISKLTKIGSQPVQLQAGVRYWAESPDTGPQGWGGRVGISFILP